MGKNIPHLRTNQKFSKHYEIKCSKKGKAKDLNNILLGYRYIPNKPHSINDDSEKEIEDDDCDIIKDEDEYFNNSARVPGLPFVSVLSRSSAPSGYSHGGLLTGESFASSAICSKFLAEWGRI